MTPPVSILTTCLTFSISCDRPVFQIQLTTSNHEASVLVLDGHMLTPIWLSNDRLTESWFYRIESGQRYLWPHARRSSLVCY